ncbi:dTDP-4-dehydrorhamnose 3,5-epimerase [Dongia sp.]|uniref:dTDP-4-dehydrorhamnose 3,5-epimerase n=1 Tax=Dongia sp. TaxID=1977262 RepID=UPI0035B4AA10
MPFDPVTTSLPEGVQLIQGRRFDDTRGWFMELHRRQPGDGGATLPDFCQDNVSLTAQAAVVRGLHFQRPPYAQAKLVTVLAGAILDILVDLRRGSPTFGRPAAVHMPASGGAHLFVPVGFAHGFCSLQPETLVHYKVSAPYAPGAEGGIAWDDPDLGIDWPFTAAEILVSEKDALLPRLRELPSIDWRLPATQLPRRQAHG